MQEVFDYAIIGGGPAGYTSAMMLAQKGHSVLLFEKEQLGGTCLNRGCIPTKSMLHSSELYSASFAKLQSIGFDVKDFSFDFSKVIAKREDAIAKIRRALELAVKNSGVKIVYEEADIKNSSTILTKTSEYNVKNIIVATGSSPKEIKGLEFDGKFILSSDDLLKLDKLPKSIVIVGSGAIGIEWARIFSNFGVEVSIIEIGEHLLPIADIEVSKRIERIFKQKKIKFYLNDCIDKHESSKVTLKSGIEIDTEKILVAVGRKPECPKFDGVKILGDACGEIQLAHFAISQAKEYVFNIPNNKNLIPSVIYGEPEIAWVGMREQECDESYQKLILPITMLGKAWCDDATEGFIKLIIKDEKIYGAHIVSKEASSLVHIALIAIQKELSIQELKELCFAHPTYAEGFGELIFKI